ncbi:MAG: hypothetical protein ABI288_04215, partial [Ginsengibacter sp.]
MGYPSVLNKRLFLSLSCLFVSFILTAQLGISATTVVEKESVNMNITQFGTIKSWDETTDALGQSKSYKEFNISPVSDSSNVGIFWWDARDVQRIEVIYDTKVISDVPMFPVVQYWQHTWPEYPPGMPTIEDMEDDPWQGTWVTADTKAKVKGNTLIFTFKPLSTQENVHADYLPGPVTYRRTLKVRLLYSGKRQNIKAINVFSPSSEKSSSIRVELGCKENNNLKIDGSLEVFNGRLKNISSWKWDKKDKKTGVNSWELNLSGNPKGIIANIYSSATTLPGSNDETVVTLRTSQGTFSFSVSDLEKGPIYVPYFNAYITKSDDSVSFLNAKLVKGETIREKIENQPEQTYDRARKEIPHLDPLQDQNGNRIYLPLASDASWQKFAVEWGGNIFMDKALAKAQDKELTRCNWAGDRLTWKIGTGTEPDFDRTEENCQMSVFNNYLPVVNSRWRQDGLNYSEEVFTTMLHGPLSPSDPGRNEQTP